MRRHIWIGLSLMLLPCATLSSQATEPLHITGKGWRVDIPNGLTILAAPQLAELDRRVARRSRERPDSARQPSTLLLFAYGKDGGTPFISLTYIADSMAAPTAFRGMSGERAMALACGDPRAYELGVTSCDSARIIQASGRSAHLSLFRRRIEGEAVRTWNLMVPSEMAYYKLTITMTNPQERRTPAQPIWESLAIDDSFATSLQPGRHSAR